MRPASPALLPDFAVADGVVARSSNGSQTGLISRIAEPSYNHLVQPRSCPVTAGAFAAVAMITAAMMFAQALAMIGNV